MNRSEPDPQARIHAIIPAAGRSTRMGTPKLLLPWNGQSVVRHLLALLLDADVTTVSILIRADDEPLGVHLQRFRDALPIGCANRLHLVIADSAPPDMRDSVAALLCHVKSLAAPTAREAWMLVPGDLVAVRPDTLKELMQQWRRNPHGVLVPTYQGRRGHPTVFAWNLFPRFEQIPFGRGVNQLLSDPTIPVTEVELDDAAILADLDTPEDYDRWRAIANDAETS